MGITDNRVKKTNEILDGIKVIKLYGWEESFTKVCRYLSRDTLLIRSSRDTLLFQEIEDIRGSELNTLRGKIKFHVINSLVWTCTPILVC